MLEAALEVVDRGCPLPVLASETELPVIVEGQEHKDASSHGRSAGPSQQFSLSPVSRETTPQSSS